MTTGASTETTKMEGDAPAIRFVTLPIDDIECTRFAPTNGRAAITAKLRTQLAAKLARLTGTLEQQFAESAMLERAIRENLSVLASA